MRGGEGRLWGGIWERAMELRYRSICYAELYISRVLLAATRNGASSSSVSAIT